jgi:DNA-binding FadR family transcriptional regulator
MNSTVLNHFIFAAKAYNPTQRVVRSLTTKIQQGAPGFRSGERLPSQGELAGEFGTSRPTLGKALRILTKRGMICWRVHDGFIDDTAQARAQMGGWREDYQQRRRSPATEEILGTRLHLEGEAAGRAAERARTSGKLRLDLEAALNRIVAAVRANDAHGTRQSDRDYHGLIFDAADTSEMLDRPEDYCLNVLPMRLAELWEARDFREEALRLNRELFESIMRCKPESARAAAHRYVDYLGRMYREDKRESHRTA